jgi:hypothetical protein
VLGGVHLCETRLFNQIKWGKGQDLQSEIVNSMTGAFCGIHILEQYGYNNCIHPREEKG